MTSPPFRRVSRSAWGGCCAMLRAREVLKCVMGMVCNRVGDCGACPHCL